MDTETQTQERQYEEREGGHVKAKENSLEQNLPSQPREGTNSADILISHFQLPELRDNKFLVFKPFNSLTALAKTLIYSGKVK